MSNQTKVVELPSWEEEHIEHLEEVVGELRDRVSTLEAQLAKKPKALNYKQKYEEVLKKLHDCWNDEIPF